MPNKAAAFSFRPEVCRKAFWIISFSAKADAVCSKFVLIWAAETFGRGEAGSDSIDEGIGGNVRWPVARYR